MLDRITYFSLLKVKRSFTLTPSTSLYGEVMARLKCEPSLCRNWDMDSVMEKWAHFPRAANVSLSAIPCRWILGPNQPPTSHVQGAFFPPGGGWWLHSRGLQFNTKLHILPKIKEPRNSTYTSILACLIITGLHYPQEIF